MKTKMRSYDFVLVVAIWFILLITGITAITQGPSNAVAEIGNQVNLTCTAETPIAYWVFSKDGSDTDMQIIVGPGCYSVNPPFGDHYEVEQFGGGTTCNLIVFDITMEQAGVYKCVEAGSYFFSILTVLDSPPAATVNTTEPVVEMENVVITCSLSYKGSVAPAPTLRPYFYWKDSDGENVNSSYNSTTENTAVSQYIVTAAAHFNITPYTCHVYFQLMPPDTTYYANNIPSVDISAISPAIEVLYGAYVYGYSHHSEFIAIGGTTCEFKVPTCVGYGNPPPSYEWFDTKENVSISNDKTLDLAEINRTYTCAVHNTIRNRVYRDTSSYVAPSSDVIQDCKFPHNESTSISAKPVEGCDSGACDCSSGYDGFTLMCKADSYPCVAYQWIGPDNSVIDSQVYDNAHINGKYRCTAYFNRASSNYTGNAIFPNGTSKKIVIECDEDMSTTYPGEVTDSNCSDVAIAIGVLFAISFAVNITILIIWLVKHLRAKQDQFKRTENVLPPEMVDLSNRTSALSAYEELNGPDETRLQQSAYEKLEPIPTNHAGPNIPKTGFDTIHDLTRKN